MKHALRILFWVILAVAITWPVAANPTTLLLGDPGIDVWNHAWGYWFVAQALGEGTLPYHTDLVGGPAGGVLYFIDTPGALVGLPLTWIGGPALGYNGVLIGRIAMAGFAAQLLARELAGPGPQTWLAGVAWATSPFLLCELANGISEVCATQWVPLVLWAAARAFRRLRDPEAPHSTVRDWAILGLMQGLTSVATFYYGLATALCVGIWFVALLIKRRSFPPVLAKRAALAAGIALLFIVPHWMAFSASLSSPEALIRRPAGLNDALLAHNAVDPLVYLMPGDFQSVNLLEVYGEPFIHTAYLRWSIILLAILAIGRIPRLRGLGVLACLSLSLGLGSYLWWDGQWFTAGAGWRISLPFHWLLQLMPEVAITHPLRLSIVGQALFVALAAAGARQLATHLGRYGMAAIVGCALIIAAEGLVGSAATWPLPTADAAIPPVHDGAEDGMVLDLPAEVGTTMETSRYFWYQTAHGRPIPYTPDVRIGSARDTYTFREFSRPGRSPTDPTREVPSQPSSSLIDHMRKTYGLILLHPELEGKAHIQPSYQLVFKQAFGEADRRGPTLAWDL